MIKGEIIIYMIRNKINNKVYIGQTTKGEERWKQHITGLNGGYGHNERIQSDWNKYGKDNFEFSIIEECSFEEIDEREKYWIKLYNSTNELFGYNILEGGQRRGKEIILTPEEREKIDEILSKHCVLF